MRVISTHFFLRVFMVGMCMAKTSCNMGCYLTHPTLSQSVLNFVSGCILLQFPAREVSVYYNLCPLVTWIEWNIISGMLDLGGCFIFIFYFTRPRSLGRWSSLTIMFLRRVFQPKVVNTGRSVFRQLPSSFLIDLCKWRISCGYLRLWDLAYRECPVRMLTCLNL